LIHYSESDRAPVAPSARTRTQRVRASVKHAAPAPMRVCVASPRACSVHPARHSSALVRPPARLVCRAPSLRAMARSPANHVPKEARNPTEAPVAVCPVPSVASPTRPVVLRPTVLHVPWANSPITRVRSNARSACLESTKVCRRRIRACLVRSVVPMRSLLNLCALRARQRRTKM
jgi:hypothetical protein